MDRIIPIAVTRVCHHRGFRRGALSLSSTSAAGSRCWMPLNRVRLAWVVISPCERIAERIPILTAAAAPPGWASVGVQHLISSNSSVTWPSKTFTCLSMRPIGGLQVIPHLARCRTCVDARWMQLDGWSGWSAEVLARLATLASPALLSLHRQPHSFPRCARVVIAVQYM